LVSSRYSPQRISISGLTANNSKMESQSMNGSLKPRGKPWAPGESGNPAGRPLGARGRYSDNFMRDLAADWAQRGPQILAQVAKMDPVRYLGVAASLIPRDVAVSIEARPPGNLSPDEWQLAREIFEAVKQALPDANQREPGQVMQFVLDAIRSHDAKLIEHERGTTTARTTI
jgi:hypothetical protein